MQNIWTYGKRNLAKTQLKRNAETLIYLILVIPFKNAKVEQIFSKINCVKSES